MSLSLRDRGIKTIFQVSILKEVYDDKKQLDL